MPTVNEHLPEDHRDHITDFGDVRDEAHVPPGNSSEGPTPTQEELLAANEAAAKDLGTVTVDTPEEDIEELTRKAHQGSSSWYSDPEAVSSDRTQAAVPGYEDNESVGMVETTDSDDDGAEDEDEDEVFDPTDYTIAEVEAYVSANPEDLARVLQAEQESDNPRSTLISKLETMR